jgi:hypothetical protein
LNEKWKWDFVTTNIPMKALVVAVALLVVPVALAQPSPQPVAGPPVSNATADKINLLGIAAMGGERYAILSLTSAAGDWKKAGQKIGRFRITSVDENSVKLVDMETNAEFTKALGSGTVKDAGKSDAPAKYSRAWINSNANPMLYHTLPMPRDIAMNWSKLSEKQREEVIAYYRQHGWQLLYTETNDGVTSGFAWKNLYEKERHDVAVANNAAFQASLNDEQRSVWNAINNTTPLRAGPESETQAFKDEVARRRERAQKFEGMLTPEQLDAYRNRTDITKHDWSKG